MSGGNAKQLALILSVKGIVDNDRVKSVHPKELHPAIFINSQNVSNGGLYGNVERPLRIRRKI